jgi:hypothetical protein
MPSIDIDCVVGTGYRTFTPGLEGYCLVAHPDGTIETKFGRPVYARTT